METFTDYSSMQLYVKAKEAYYDGGEETMTDSEFDELEKELGLENKGYIGNISSSYTVKHPVVMGSLSKVQVKEIDGNIDWPKYHEEALSYLAKADKPLYYIITPKYDGCSFEVIVLLVQRPLECQLEDYTTHIDVHEPYQPMLPHSHYRLLFSAIPQLSLG